MGRFWLALLLASTLAAAPSRADDPASSEATAASANDAAIQKDDGLVDPAAVQKRADQLHDAVANPSIDNFAVHKQAADFFEGLQRRTPLFRPAPRKMDREIVDGRVGTIEGMIAEAKKRYDHYKLTTTAVPPPGLEESMAYARTMRDDHRADFATMAENQMGEFRYAVGAADRGRIGVNNTMALIATRIGEAFAYATLVHEATHAREHAQGRLAPDHVIDGEVDAYLEQYHWLKALDPRAERMIVMISTLNLHLQEFPGDLVARSAYVYMQHLLTLWDTGGGEQKLRAMIRNLGYEDGDSGRPGGVNPAAAGPRV